VVVEAQASRQGEVASPGGQRGGGSVGDSGSPAVSRRPSELAVKVVRRASENDELVDHEQLAMWEMHVLQQLHHPHIVKVRDVIDLVDATYIVMERVDGPELGDHIAGQSRGRLPPESACRIFVQMLAALNSAHSTGFLHCDIKPANIRLTQTCDFAVLTDWGLSKQIGSSPCHASMCGTPAYAPPEQLTGYCPDGIVGGQRKLCPAADIWSLGATLHEMLTGVPPFRGETFDELVRNVISLRYYTAFPDDVPAAAVELVHSMLQVCPSDRATLPELIASEWVGRCGSLPPCLLDQVRLGIQCEPCETDADDPKVHGPFWKRVRWKEYGLRLFYLSLCVGAVGSHLYGGGGASLELVDDS